MLRNGVVRVFVSFCVLVFVRAILSWCPENWHIYIVYNIRSLNILLEFNRAIVGMSFLNGPGWMY